MVQRLVSLVRQQIAGDNIPPCDRCGGHDHTFYTVCYELPGIAFQTPSLETKQVCRRCVNGRVKTIQGSGVLGFEADLTL